MQKRTRKPPIKKLALVGSASNTKDLVPWEDDSVEIWGLAWRKDLIRVNRLFEMHPFAKHRYKIPKNYVGYLASLRTPVYLLQEHHRIPNGVVYPIDVVIQRLGPMLDKNSDGDYFASSIAYLLALAIVEEYDEIQLYGIDFIDTDEYGHQRPNMEYLIGVARGLGISVYIPRKAALCYFPYRYGYELPDFGLIDSGILKEREKQYNEQWEKARCEFYTADGARQEVRQLLKITEQAKKGRRE
ncbi:hypothetical protein LCGC14_0232130 [marine sediment metagenome]|uniref:Uncharacterized protein n=1 Tax=marine sediment metagenome TaxID=412755 RepID=A0A0F9UA81_9ZZZZ